MKKIYPPSLPYVPRGNDDINYCELNIKGGKRQRVQIVYGYSYIEEIDGHFYNVNLYM